MGPRNGPLWQTKGFAFFEIMFDRFEYGPLVRHFLAFVVVVLDDDLGWLEREFCFELRVVFSQCTSNPFEILLA